MFVSAGVGFLHDLVETAGGQNAFADVKRESMQVSSEAMLARAPEVIIETHQSSWDTSATAREQAVWRTLAGAAGGAHRIASIWSRTTGCSFPGRVSSTPHASWPASSIPAWTRRSSRSHELDRYLVGDQALLVGLAEEPLERGAAAFTVVERQRVDVHAHELIGGFAIQAAAELLRVLDRIGTIVQRMRDAVVQHLRDARHQIRARDRDG